MNRLFVCVHLTAHRSLALFLCIILLSLFSSCKKKGEPKGYTIGFSQCTGDPWRDIMLEEMKRELSFHPAITLIYKQADGNTQKQISQVNELINQKIDLLIVSPNEADPLTPAVEKAFRKGIPVIVLDRKISSDLYTAYVGGDNYEVGRRAGEYAVNLLRGKGNIVEVTLLPGSSNALERHNGFVDAIKNYPSLRIIQLINGEKIKQNDYNGVSAVFSKQPDVDLIYAQNDFLAVKIADFFKKKGINKTKIIGVDGLPGKGEGMDLVTNKIITASMLYPTGGEEAIRTASKILNGESFSKVNNLQTTVIDSTNVRYMQMQASKMTSQQQSIEKQQDTLVDLKKIYTNMRTFLYVLISLLILALAFGGIALYSMRQNKKMNKKLQLQNLEILDQKNKVEELSAKAQAANEARVSFFTNISHEFRTPLTLILAPLEELLAITKNHSFQNESLNLIYKNVIRLLRLVDQLLDFRKIEVDKMRVRASENDLISFVSDIIMSYKSIANKRNVDLRIITNERHLNVWFDVNMLDKVIFNLLSNAFKFTEDNGFVHIYINKSEDAHEAIIKVEDNGIGMSADTINNAFELFYQGEHGNSRGSGLGLALSKELVKLHKGSITAFSEKHKGTTFEIRLPLGQEHLEKQDLIESLANNHIKYEDRRVYTSDLETEHMAKNEMSLINKENEYSILVIEDNEELRNFIKSRLAIEYEIIEADNGQSALQQAFDIVPDLIISDVVIPGKDGMALVNIFKTDIRTSHIPIILLTVKTNIAHQIEGMKNRADVYITKPFNVQLLQQTIKSLLSNRAMLKEHFTSALPSSLKTQTVNKIDRKFIGEFTALVEGNLSNEDFSVEEISKKMGISRMQLNRKVKALLNINVNDYILNIRLQKAKYLLQHEELSISDVSYKVGFSSPAYFSTVFKSKFNLTPKAFKEQST